MLDCAFYAKVPLSAFTCDNLSDTLANSMGRRAMLRWREVVLACLAVGFVGYLFVLPAERRLAIDTGARHRVDALERSFGPASAAIKRLVRDAMVW